MRYSRLVRLIARLFLLILASTMSLVSFLGGYSALLILSDEDNIDLDVTFEGDLTAEPSKDKDGKLHVVPQPTPVSGHQTSNRPTW